jgi:hypothetical protein
MLSSPREYAARDITRMWTAMNSGAPDGNEEKAGDCNREVTGRLRLLASMSVFGLEADLRIARDLVRFARWAQSVSATH